MNSLEELELQFSPSMWSKRYSAEEVVRKHVEFVSGESEEVKRQVPCELNVSYGSSVGEKYDLFGIDLPDDAPMFIYIHGGYWQELSRDISSYAVKPLYKNGVKVAVLGYDLCPTVSLPEIVEEVRKGLSECFKYAKSKKSRGVFLAGHSAGAHLAASVFMKKYLDNYEEQLKAVFLLGGVYDLVPLVKTYVNDALHLNANLAEQLSPLKQTFYWGGSVSFFILIGEHESPEFRKQSTLFYKKLRSSGYTCQLISLNNVGHFDSVELLSDENYEVTQLIINEIKASTN